MVRFAKILQFFFLFIAVPMAYVVYLETNPSTTVYSYHSAGFFRECAKWDRINGRFLVSFLEGGIGQVVPSSSDDVMKEETVVKDFDLADNSSLGLCIDYPRNRLLVAVSDMGIDSYSALAAYDLSTWNRLFLTQLSGRRDKGQAEDVAVDFDGNAYVTDVNGNKIWKLGVDGKLVSTIESPLFYPKAWYGIVIGLNGIVFHPDGFLIVVHSFRGKLYKIDLDMGGEVQLIDVRGSIRLGDGLHLLSPKKLVVAGPRSSQLVESSDGWETASVVGSSKGIGYRLGTAATVKDDKVFVSHFFGLGYPKKKHVIVEAVFT